LKSIMSPFTAMLSTPLSSDDVFLISFQSPANPGPPETRVETAVMVNIGPSSGKTSCLLVRVFPSAEIEIFAFRVVFPPLVVVIEYPLPALVQVVIVSSVFCGFPSHTTFGCALPPRVTVKPVASVATENAGPSYL